MNYLLKYYKPILTTLLIAVVIFGVGGTVRAEGAAEVACGANQALEKTWDMTVIASLLIHLMAWAWSIPAVLAGELMSNDLVYGQIVGLEHYFYQFWTLMRTIANFSLVAIIIMVIGKIMTNGGKAGEVLNKYGIRLLAAGILINFSWFLMWALVDVSTILIAGVGQIGNQAMEKVVNPTGTDAWRINWIIKAIPDKIEVDKCWCLTKTSISTSSSKTRDEIVTKRNSISGPLIVLGAGVMKLHAFSMDITCKSGTLGDFGKLTLRMVMQIFLMIMFIVPLLVLVAFNFFRLIYLWWWIICSPLIVLINLFEEVGKIVWDDIKKAVSPGTMINGLLQPVFTVWALVIGMMLVMGMYHALDFTKTETLDSIHPMVDWIVNKEASSQIGLGNNGNLGSVTLIDKIIEDPTATLGGWFGYLLVSFATCFVLWMLVKLSFSMSKWWVWAAMWFDAEKMMDKMRGEFMQRVKLPAAMWWPLGGASLKEAASFIDPTDKDNRIMKQIDKVSGEIKSSGEDKANKWLESSRAGKLLGMQNNSDIPSDKSLTTIGDADPKNSASVWIDRTKAVFGDLKTIAWESSWKTFMIDRADRKSYKEIKKWYEKDWWGKSILKKFKIKDPKNEKEEIDLPIPDFDKEFNVDSHLWWLIKYLSTAEKIEVDVDGKLKGWDPSKPSNKFNLSKIDFKKL